MLERMKQVYIISIIIIIINVVIMIIMIVKMIIIMVMIINFTRKRPWMCMGTSHVFEHRGTTWWVDSYTFITYL